MTVVDDWALICVTISASVRLLKSRGWSRVGLSKLAAAQARHRLEPEVPAGPGVPQAKRSTLRSCATWRKCTQGKGMSLNSTVARTTARARS